MKKKCKEISNRIFADVREYGWAAVVFVIFQSLLYSAHGVLYYRIFTVLRIFPLYQRKQNPRIYAGVYFAGFRNACFLCNQNVHIFPGQSSLCLYEGKHLG